MIEVKLRGAFRVSVLEPTPTPSPAPPPSSGIIRRVKKWGMPGMPSTAGLPYYPQSNFQAVQLATVDQGVAWFGAVTQFQPNIDREYLRSLQRDGGGYTIQQKMNWLGEGSDKGRPYFEKSSGLAFGTIVFGGQLIETMPTKYFFTCKYPDGDKTLTNQLFWRINGFRRSDIGKGYTHQSHPHLINRATAANGNPSPDNTYDEFPRDEVFHLVWDCRDWPANERDGVLYIADAFLE